MNKDIFLTNNLSNKKEKFVPLDEENIELVNLKNGKKISIIEHIYDPDQEFYIAKLSQTLKEGTKYRVSHLKTSDSKWL